MAESITPDHDGNNVEPLDAAHLTRRDFLRVSATAAVATGIGLQQLSHSWAATDAKAAGAENEFVPSPLETRVLGANTVLAGSQAALRIVTVDHRSGAPVAAAGVRISLVAPDKNGKPQEQTLYKGFTNRRGTVDAAFTMPALTRGSYELRVNTTSTLGTDSFSAPLTITESAQILLTTDKPLYQPSQTIHLRALALARPALKPVSGKVMVFEVEDAKGNKVFKKEVNTGDLGVAATTFVLANEVNLGRYTVRTTLGDNVTEKKVTVERYVLPKFKINLTTDKSYYLPGETIKGTAQVDYFFGKAVVGGEVTIKAATFDIGFNEFAELKGTTDAAGTYKFETRLPQSMVGLPLEQGKALVKLEAAVKDKAEHTEQVTRTVPVAKDAIAIAVVPESGALVPGVENVVYVLTNYPDGAPAPSRFTFKSNGIDLAGTTDKQGIGEVKLTPREGFRTTGTAAAAGAAGKMADDNGGAAFARRRMAPAMNIPAHAVPKGEPLQVQIVATDMQGNRGSANASLDRLVGDDSVMLRTNRAVARVGETLELDIVATKAGGTVYVDIIKDKQTVLTRSVYLRKGRGELRLDLDETLAGTLQAHAYLIGERGEIVRDTKIVYVNAASDLKIKVEPDKSTYRPGAPAQINLQVSDARGYPVLAALGVNIVDESVFALQEMQPGMEKIYFTLEKELLEPKVEIHGHDAEEVVPLAQEKSRLNPDKQKIARVLFAAAQPMVEYGMTYNSFDAKLAKIRPKWEERLGKDATRIGQALEKYRAANKKLPAMADALKAIVEAELVTKADVRDPLGTPYELRPLYGQDLSNGFTLASAGIDRKWNTVDDMQVQAGIGGVLYRADAFARRRMARGMELEMADGDMVAGGFAGPRGAPGAAGAMPMAAPMVANGAIAMMDAKSVTAPAAEPVRVRQYFPETLFVNPQVLTDARGRASIKVDMADSITTWRLTTMASSGAGALGSTTAPLRVFQDFFVDLDLPVSLTKNDEITIPVAVYNYLPEAQTVRLKLETPAGAWFEMVSDEADKAVQLGPNQVGVVNYRIAARAIGNHKLAVTARGSKLSDAIERTIEVLPDGRQVAGAINDRLEGDVKKTIHIPAEAQEGASGIMVRIYPGAFSQVVDGLDKMLQMPYGCFEQNASVAYPNVLVMDYLRRTKQIKPELEMKVEAYINTGYQRALTYEVPGGGFSWFGQAPAHKILTAYGLLLFTDMAKVHHVDPALITRTQQWLANLQKGDGSWEADTGGIQEGIIDRQNGALRIAAYILWALAETGYQGPQLAKAAAYVGAHFEGESDAYTIAVVANALVSVDKTSAAAGRAVERLISLKIEEPRTAYWKSEAQTYTGARGSAADIETTALAAYALLRSGRAGALATKALTYLVNSKDPQGNWGSTQATVWSLRALLGAMKYATADTNGEVIVRINGEQAAAFAITPKDADVMRQIDLKQHIRTGDNDVEIKFSGQGSALYAISSKFYLPWGDDLHPTRLVTNDENSGKPLDITVKYDRTELAVNDMVTCKVRIANRQTVAVRNVIVDLGIPPGFEVQTGDLAELVGSKKIARFSPTGRQVIVYLDGLAAGQVLEFDYRLKAKFPLRAKAPSAAVYEYYTPKNRTETMPVNLVVSKA